MSTEHSNGAAVKPRLVPARVPWQISPSVPYLTLLPRDSADGQPVEVTFVGHFALEPSQPETQSFSGQAVWIKDPPEDFVEAPSDRCQYRLVKILFSHAVRAEEHDAFSDTEAIEEACYDWSAVPSLAYLAEGPEAYVRKFREYWRDTGICPNPGFYEVLGSPGLETGMRRFLMRGQDTYIDVVAGSWEWIGGQALPGW